MSKQINTSNSINNQKSSNNKEIPLHLQKDFKVEVSINDFKGKKDTKPKNLGFFDKILTLLYKNNKTSYYVKIIDKKNIINNSYQNILDINYKICNNESNSHFDDYTINLETQWEDNERLYLVFEGIKRYTLLEKLIKKNSENITEKNLIIIYRQILESVSFLHNNNLFGCFLNLNSFIYDKLTQTKNLRDTGYSKVFLPSKEVFDNVLQNGFKFNEYTPPEIFASMGASYNINEIEKLKNEKYDIWQLGILFYKIASFDESPYNDAKNENLKDNILSKTIDYSKLNKYSSQIVQIIDKMLQIVPENRYSIQQLLSLTQFQNNKIPLLNISSSKKEETLITMKMVNEKKQKIGTDFKIEKEINNNEEEENQEETNENKKSNKKILKSVKIQGNLVNNKNYIINQEIYPEGSVLPTFKKNSLRKLNQVDQNLVMDLAGKLTLLDKEYHKLEENKMAVYNITNYVNKNLKILNNIDIENMSLLIKKFTNLLLSKTEANDLYAEMVKEKGEFSQDKFKALISNLIYEIKRLKIELEQERSTSEKLRKKIKEQEERNIDLKNEHAEKIQFYQKKIEILEDVIFSAENKGLNEKDFKNKHKLIYFALANSIQDFTEVNHKLRSSIEDNLSKFHETKKNWLEELIKAQKDLREEISFYLEKSVEKPKVYVFEKKEFKEDSKEAKKNEEIEKLKKQIEELQDLTKEQNNTIITSTNNLNKINRELKLKNEEIEALKDKLNNLDKQGNK